MSKTKINVRDQRDPAGNLVDVYPEIELVMTLVFDDKPEPPFDHFLRKIIRVLINIREHKNKKVRDRDFPVWTGHSVNRLGMRLFTIALPYGIHSKVFELFFQELSEEDTYLEAGGYLLRDMNGVPTIRYLQGKLIVYVAPFEEQDKLTKILTEFETEFKFRSWETKRKQKRKSPYTTVNAPEYTSTRYHNLGIWDENRKQILDFLTELKGACGYNQLKKITNRNFGINVFEESRSDFYKHGCIRLGWLRDDMSAGVRILINSDLDYKLKYIILAHELSHYCLHFPILLIGQIVEETSWTIPEFELYYFELLTKYSQDFLEILESDANQLASFFLLPPWMYPLERLSNVILEGGAAPSPEELVWRFLQPLFPDTACQEFSWINWQQMKEKMLLEVNTTLNERETQSIYTSILDAALRREREENLRKRVDKLVERITEQIVQAFMLTNQLESAEARDYIVSLMDSKKVRVKPNSHSLSELGFHKTSFLKEIVPPIAHSETSSLFPKIPLIPAIYNEEGQKAGDWLYLPKGLDSPAGTVGEWLKHKHGYGLALYRYETWQVNAFKKL